MVQHCHLDINVNDIGHLFLRELTYKFNLEEQAIVKVHCDNTTAMTYVNEMGGTKSIKVAMRLPPKTGIGASLTMLGSRVPIFQARLINTLADMASRLVNDRHEWKLNVRIFHQLCEIFGTPVSYCLVCFKA